jgi:U2-associated protein SR140
VKRISFLLCPFLCRQRDRLEDLLRNMTPERLKVAESMVFCIEHSEAADEICDCIAESLSILQTPIPKKVITAYDPLCGCGTWCVI